MIQWLSTVEASTSEDIKTKRLARLNEVLDTQTRAHHQKEVGQEQTVLFCYESPREKNLFYGRTPAYHSVRAYSQENIVGQKRSVKITQANKAGLLGELI